MPFKGLILLRIRARRRAIDRVSLIAAASPTFHEGRTRQLGTETLGDLWKGEGWGGGHGEYKMEITGTFRKESRDLQGSFDCGQELRWAEEGLCTTEDSQSATGFGGQVGNVAFPGNIMADSETQKLERKDFFQRIVEKVYGGGVGWGILQTEQGGGGETREEMVEDRKTTDLPVVRE